MTKIIQKQDPGLFDYQERLEKLLEKGFPLNRLNERINWEIFRRTLEETLISQTQDNVGGRPRYDVVMMFKILILQRYYSLSDDQAEFQINDRLSFQKFLGITLSDRVPDAKSLWLFREDLTRKNVIKKLFKRFEQHLRESGLIGNAGKIVDASFVDVPKQRNNRDDNAIIKNGAIPLEFGKNEHKLRQKDTEARWTKKREETHYGYKNHIKADSKSKLVEDYTVTPANTHDSQAMESLVETDDHEIWADSAYTGQAVENELKKKQVTGKICEKGYRNNPLTEEQKTSNREKSRIRVRVEHVFGFIANSMQNGLKLRAIGLARTTALVGLINLVYNMARYEQILRLQLL